jgi:hypothetical protein
MATLLDFSLFYHPVWNGGGMKRFVDEVIDRELGIVFREVEDCLFKRIKRVDKLFLEGVVHRKKDEKDVKMRIRRGRWSGDEIEAHLRRILERYNPTLVGIERAHHYLLALPFPYFLKRPMFTQVRSRDFAKIISKELKRGEIGIAYHGRSHDEMLLYLKEMNPKIRALKVNPPPLLVASIIHQELLKSLGLKGEKKPEEQILRWRSHLEEILKNI